jgi:hypothetical protein
MERGFSFICIDGTGIARETETGWRLKELKFEYAVRQKRLIGKLTICS